MIFACCNVSGQRWMNSKKLAEENVYTLLLKKVLSLSAMNCCKWEWSRKNYFNNSLTGWNSFNGFHIDVQAEKGEIQTSTPWADVNHMKTKFSVYFDELEHYFTAKRSETTYLRDKQDILFFLNIHDLAISVRRSNQLSYETTDVGSWSFLGSNKLVRNEWMMEWYMKYIVYWTADVKSNKL